MKPLCNAESSIDREMDVHENSHEEVYRRVSDQNTHKTISSRFSNVRRVLVMLVGLVANEYE